MRRALRYLVYTVLGLAVLVAGTIYWIAGTQRGAEFVIGKLQELLGTATKIEGVEGAIGGQLRIRLFEVVRPELVIRIEDLETDISPVYTGRLTVNRFHARSVEVRTSPASHPQAAQASPPQFVPPFPVRLGDGGVGTFTYGAIGSHDKDVILTDVVLRGEGDAARWTIAEARAGTPYGKVKLSGSIAAVEPFGLDAGADFDGEVQQQPAHATAKATGTLRAIEVKVEAAAAGARASAKTTIQPFAAPVVGSIAVDAGGVDLARWIASMPSTRLTLQAKLTPRDGGIAGSLHLANAEPGPWDARRLPLVSASTQLAVANGGVDLSAIDVKLPAGSVRGTMHVGSAGAQADLHIEGVDLATLHGGLRNTQLAGKLAIAGDSNAQQFEVALEDPRFALEGRATLAAKRIEVQSATVRAGGGTVSATGAAALAGKKDFHVEGEARDFDPSAFSKAPGGSLNFAFAANGVLGDAPAGEVKVDIKPGTYSGLATSGHVRVAGDAHRIASADADVSWGEARLTVKGSLGRAGDAMDVTLHAPDLAKLAKPFGASASGSLDSHVKLAGPFETCSVDVDAQAAMDPKRTAKVSVRGAIARKGDAFAWAGRVEALSVTGPGAFTLVAPATLAIARDDVDLGDATVRGDWGEAHLEVTRWAKGAFELKGSAPSVNVKNVARTLDLEEPARMNLVFSAGWNLRAAETIEGTVTVKRESGDVFAGDPELPMGLSEAALAVEISRGRLHGTLNVSGTRIGNIRGEAHGAIGREGNAWEFTKASPLDARVVATIPDLSMLQPWIGDEVKVGGRLDADLAVTGTGADPRVEGKARFQDLALREARSGFELTKGTGSLRLDGKSLVIDDFSAKSPWHVPDGARDAMRHVQAPPDGGTLTAAGSVDFSSHAGSIRVKIDRIPVTQLPSRFISVSGEANIVAEPKATSITGSFKADGGWIGALAQAAPTPSDDIVVIRAQAQPADTKSKQPIRIDISASLGDGIAFQGRGLDTELAGDMRVVGEIGAPLRATGSIRTVRGTYEGYGQKLTIDRGVLTFAGPIDNPKLNILATRKGLQVEPGVEVTGTSARPRVRLVSTPDVPESEKLSWLVLGRSASGAGPGDLSMLTTAAGALMGEGKPGGGLQKRLGIDEISIGHSDTGSPLGVMPQSTVAGRTGAPAATDVVTIGSQLTSSVRMSYEQGFADAEGALKVTWSITKQFHLLVRAGYLPGLDLVYRWTLK